MAGSARFSPGPGVYIRSVDIRVLGPLEVRLDQDPVPLGGPKQRALLALLIANARGVVSRDALIEGLWGEEPSSGARSTMLTYVSNLRQVLGDAMVHDRGGYRLGVEPESIDALRFEAALKDARSLLTTDSSATAAELRHALALWRGRPYADLPDVPGLDSELRRLEQLRLEAVELRIDAELASGQHSTLVAQLEALAEEYPFRERFRAQHMLALYRSGRQAEALRAFRRTQEYLAEELGVEASRELQDLELAILEHDDALLGGPGRVVTQRLAFLVTDIEDSTRLWDQLPQHMAKALAIHDQVVLDAIEGAGGRVFKNTGEGLFAAFPDSGRALDAAEAAQRALAAVDWGDVGGLAVRIGLDVGEAESRGGDFLGPPLNRAARLCSIGHGGQVLISAGVQREISASAPAGLQIRHLGEVHLRGMATPEPVAQVVFAGLPADFPDLRTGTSALDDRVELVALPGYEVRDRLGEGSFGVVWRAYQPSVGREVAVKVIRPQFASQPSFVRRFEAEARTIARLAHPHIVPLIDFWRDTESAYLVLGLLTGGSLETAMPAVDRSSAVRILGQIGAALDHAHSQGISHGDVKPANVLLDGAGNAYLSDFGIAARILYPELVGSVSQAPQYRAPEEGNTGPTPATDCFAFGVLARELLDAPPELEPVVTRATAGNPDDRYPSMSAFLADLNRVLGEAPSDDEQPVVSRNPYKGLRAFEESDATDFYGRDELVSTLVAAVSERRFVTVVGPSGSGKSSLVQAGLLPRLTGGALDGSERWFRTLLTPGPAPVEALADSLEAVSIERVDPDDLAERGLTAIGGEDLLVVVDQFEELYTLADHDQRHRFLDLLASAAEDPDQRVRVVATLRADFYDKPLMDERIGRMVRDGLVTVLPPTRDELVEMINMPAQSVGLRWEPGLPHRIAGDVADQPGGLPLLQYALTELVELRSGHLLTAADYEQVGGVGGALATRAESVYRGFSTDQKDAAREIFLRLVTVDEDTDDTRRRVRRIELESLGIPRETLEYVLDSFTSQRLLLGDRDPATRGPTVEVVHEALLREWPRLAGWIDDQREALVLGRQFRAALAEWEANDRHVDYLLTGNRLAAYRGWADAASLTSGERNFFLASRDRDDHERSARHRRRHMTTWALAATLVVVSSLAAVALWQRGVAQSEARQETVRQLAASSTLALREDPELAILLAREAAEVSRRAGDAIRPEAIRALHRAVQTSRLEMRLGHGLESVDVSPDGLILATDSSSPDSPEPATDVLLWDTTDGTLLATLSGPSRVTGVSFNPDGRLLAVDYSGEEPATVLWDPVTGQEVTRLERPGDQAVSPASWGPDGELIAIPGWSQDTGIGSVTLWDPSSRAEVSSFTTGGRLVTFWDNQTLIVADPRVERFVFHDVVSGEEVDTLSTPGFAAQVVAVDPRRGVVVAGSQPHQTVGAWAPKSGTELWTLTHPTARVASVDPITERVAILGNDGEASLHDLEDGSEMMRLPGHGGPVLAAVFSGPHLVTTSLDGKTRFWNVEPNGPPDLGTIHSDTAPVFSISFSPDGTEMALSTFAGVVTRVDIASGAATDVLIDQHTDYWTPSVISPDWQFLAAVDISGNNQLREMNRFDALIQLPLCTTPKAFNSDASALVLDGARLCEPAVRSRIIDPASGEELLDLGSRHIYGPRAVFSSAGTLDPDRYVAFIVRPPHVAEIHDLQTGEHMATIEFPDDEANVVNIDPSGQYLLGGNENGRAWALDLTAIVSGASVEEAMVLDFTAHTGGVTDLALSSGGILATQSFGSLRLWDFETATHLIDIDVDLDDPPYALFSPDEDYLLYRDSGGETGDVLRRFLLDPDELIALADSRLTRSFTAEECDRYNIDC